ncbi:MAG: hypothetical protein EBY26_01520 [Microbacteriaceae bacterium]|nr:hypothetical protein [Microbacteriaceae bacterium]
MVAVLDSGITNHPDLNGQILPGYDFISDKTSSRDGDGWDSDPTDQAPPYKKTKSTFGDFMRRTLDP